MVIALDGRDSPNFDFPDHLTKVHFKDLIGHKKFNGVISTKGTDCWEYWSQCVGKPQKGMNLWRVLSKDWAIRHKACEDTIWSGTPTTSIYGIDPSYGGGDDCIGIKIDYGTDIDNKYILSVSLPEQIPVSPKNSLDPEEQIAAFTKNRLEQLGIPPQNCFYDSFGRGTLGFAFSKLFHNNCPIPIDSGAQPTTRPVRFDLWVEEKGGNKRLKRCDEHYTKFISEMWFSVREVIESEQMRNLDAQTLREGCSRKFTKNKNAKIEVEPKEEMKERLKHSPNKMDALAIAIEGARRLGFKIKHASLTVPTTNKPDWLDKYATDYHELIKNGQLQND